MSTVSEIEAAIQKLSPSELAALRAWFTEYDNAQWDQQLENDIAAGRLDALAEEALFDHREGRSTEL